MSVQSYDLVFRGKIHGDVSLENAKENLGRLLKVDAQKVDMLFSGQPCVIKKSLDASVAEKYIGHLKKQGLDCELVPLETGSLSLMPMDSDIKNEQVPDVLVAECARELKILPNENVTITKKIDIKRDAAPEGNAERGAEGGEGEPLVEVNESFYSLVWGSFSHPLRGQGLLVLLAGTFLFIVMSLAMNAPFFLGWFAAIFAFGYMSSYMMDVLLNSASGEERLPGFPGYDDFFTSAVQPLMLVGGSAFFCFLPALAVYNSDIESLPLLVGCVFIGAFLLPSSLILITLTQSLMCLNPISMIRIITKTFRDYIFAVLMLLGIVGASVLIDMPATLIGVLVEVFVQLYLLVVAMKIIGLICYCNSEKL